MDKENLFLLMMRRLIDFKGIKVCVMVVLNKIWYVDIMIWILVRIVC